MFGGDRSELRQMYAEAWRKYRAGDLMSPLETEISAVIAIHPEYHQFIAERNIEATFSANEGQDNPFLHMGLHLALREQINTDRPAGIAAIQCKLATKVADQHIAEHVMIEALAETLREARSGNCAPDEAKYLQRLRRLS